MKASKMTILLSILLAVTCVLGLKVSLYAESLRAAAPPAAPTLYRLTTTSGQFPITNPTHEVDGSICGDSVVAKKKMCLKAAEYILLAE